jgi:hypothetical protein
MEVSAPDVAGIIIESECDRRIYNYLVQTCGEARVATARNQLPGRTRPYVSNLAKMLGVTIPNAVVTTPKEEARRHLAEIKKIIRPV